MSVNNALSNDFPTRNALNLKNISYEKISFEDDKVVILIGKNWAKIYKNSINVMNRIVKWLNISLFTVNITKSKHLRFPSSIICLPKLNDIFLHYEDC